MDSENSFDYLLYLLLRRTTTAVNKLRDKELEILGTNARKSGVLRAILRMGDDVSITRISKQLFLEDHTVSEQIKRMEEDGLIKKDKNPEKNTIRITITDKGYEMYLKTKTQESIDDLMTSLTKKEKKQLWILLTKLREKAVKDLGIKNPELFPPSNYGDAEALSNDPT